MKQKKIPVKQLMEETAQAMERAGYSKRTFWASTYKHFRTIEMRHLEAEKEFYDPHLTERYLEERTQHYTSGIIRKGTLREIKKALRYLCNYYEYGYILPPDPKKRTQYIPNKDNRIILERFLASREFSSEKAKKDFSWAVRKYMCYFEGNGIDSLENVTAGDVQTFIQETSAATSGGTMHDLMCYLRQFQLFLRDTEDISAPGFADLMSFTVIRETHIQDYITDEELTGILNAIDTNTEQGKRDKAIFVLASLTGLRGCDVIHMKLSDIDWRRGEIRIRQRKTGRDLALPLMPAAGNAVQEYILTARPAIDSEILFLSVMPPYRPIKDAAHLTDLIKKYQKKAGIVRTCRDGKGFHGLRRRLAHNMITTGTPVTTIAQVLGHTDMTSVEKYLSFDDKNLKECALDFSGIPLKGGA